MYPIIVLSQVCLRIFVYNLSECENVVGHVNQKFARIVFWELVALFTLWKLSTGRELKKTSSILRYTEKTTVLYTFTKERTSSLVQRKQGMFAIFTIVKKQNMHSILWMEKTVHVWYTRGNKIN